jgi:hypothetical protein
LASDVLVLLTAAIQTYLAKEPLDDLVTLLTKARVVNRLLDFMPPSKRSLEDLSAHFRWGFMACS